jgi:toxin YoeB
MSKLLFSDNAWEDYLYWQSQDKKTLKRINALVKDIERNGNEGIGKAEPLREDLSGYWSRHIDSPVPCVVASFTSSWW